MGGPLRVAGDLPATRWRALGLSAQPPAGLPYLRVQLTRPSEVQRQVIGVAQGSRMFMTIHVLEATTRILAEAGTRAGS
jgi:hypothetical protein